MRQQQGQLSAVGAGVRSRGRGRGSGQRTAASDSFPGGKSTAPADWQLIMVIAATQCWPSGCCLLAYVYLLNLLNDTHSEATTTQQSNNNNNKSSTAEMYLKDGHESRAHLGEVIVAL